MRARAAALAGASSLALACAPLTFSNDAPIDFDVYRSVRVEMLPSTQHAAYAAQYLAERLAQSSGFERVTLDDGADLILEVDLSVRLEIDTDSEGNLETEYVGIATYVASTPSGRVIDWGSEEDASATELEVIEDLLDEIEYHYFAPYRY